jgi:hypothetical protein
VPKKQVITTVGDIQGKICTKCKVWLPLEDFHKEKLGTGGKRSDCKECNKKRNKDNRDPEKRKLYMEKNKDKFKIYFQKRYQENKEILSQKRKERYQRDKEKESEYGKAYHYLNKEKENARSLKYYHENKERINRKRRIWNKENPQILKAQRVRRVAKKKSLPSEITSAHQQELLNHFKGCALTGVNENLHFDHIIPLATGHGGSVIENMVPIRADLNLSKNDSNIFEWFETNRQRFKLSQEKFDSLISWLAKSNHVSVEDYKDHVYWCHDNPHCLEDLQNVDESKVI